MTPLGHNTSQTWHPVNYWRPILNSNSLKPLQLHSHSINRAHRWPSMHSWPLLASPTYSHFLHTSPLSPKLELSRKIAFFQISIKKGETLFKTSTKENLSLTNSGFNLWRCPSRGGGWISMTLSILSTKTDCLVSLLYLSLKGVVLSLCEN